MRNTGLAEAQAGIKIARRNVNNFRYADDTTLRAENEDAFACMFFTTEPLGKSTIAHGCILMWITEKCVTNISKDNTHTAHC